jgi:hypothetical protein
MLSYCFVIVCGFSSGGKYVHIILIVYLYLNCHWKSNNRTTILCLYQVRTWIRVTRSLVLCVMFCRSLFVLLYLFFWPLCCLFIFDIRILITPLVSSKFSSQRNNIILFFFFLLVQCFDMRGGCSLCWCSWNCWPSLLKLSFHNLSYVSALWPEISSHILSKESLKIPKW